MYFYFYDSFLKDKKFEIPLNRIEARLVDLGINGRIEKLTLLKNMREMIEDGIKKGAQTIVAVGNDRTLSEVIKVVAPHDVVLGFIPLGEPLSFSRILAIPSGERACDILSARIIEKLDLGTINGNYFLSRVEIKQGPVTIECDGHYAVSSLRFDNAIKICNLAPQGAERNSIEGIHSDPRDGILEAVVTPSTSSPFRIFKRQFSRESVFPIRQVLIKSEKEALPILADGQVSVKTPARVAVAPQKLKIIVGKKRMF